MPNRILKESICSSDTIDSLSFFEEVFFYRLIVNCDDYGRLDARPAILKARLFPLKNITEKQVTDAMNKLKSAGIVTTYMVEAKPYLQIVTWASHQQIRNKRSKFPGIEAANEDEAQSIEDIGYQLKSNDINCTRNPIQSESNPNPNPTPKAVSSDDCFERWWLEYPKKVGKAEARKIFNKLKPSEDMLATMMASVDRQKKSAQWLKDDGQFIPNPATWLNQGRWDDELPESSNKSLGRSKYGNLGNFDQREYSEEFLDSFNLDLFADEKKEED